MSYELMGFKNVFTDDDMDKYIQNRAPSGYNISVIPHPILAPLVKELAILKPTWQLVCTDVSKHTQSDLDVVFAGTTFAVRENGEFLGLFKREYARRDYRILVRNQRIMQGRERGSGYATDDWKKALTKIKRAFGRKSTQERVAEAYETMSNYVSRAEYDRREQHKDTMRPVISAAHNYVMGDGFATFMEHVRNHLPRHIADQLVEATYKAETIKSEMVVLEDIRSKIGTKKSALIIKDMDQYIVRVNDNVQLYDDNTLPVVLRGKLGMLKLVEKEHFIEGTGCRVTDEIFVVVMDDEIVLQSEQLEQEEQSDGDQEN